MKEMKMDIGITEASRKAICKQLDHLLADTYSLYLKTHNFHWNVTGSMFQTLHLMFEKQYNEMWISVDEIAERIRALGYFAPGTYREFGKLSSIPETEGIPTADKMIHELVDGHEAVCRTARAIFPLVQEAHDEGTNELLTTRLQYHEKTAWMLRSLLAK